MYSSASTVEMKEKFLMSFSKVDSTLRVLIATTAFGTGVDIPNIRWIVHWSPLRLIEDYVQETERAGRDGLTATALLVYGHLHRTVSSSMKKYGQNFTTCLMKCLFAGSEDSAGKGCGCCDICVLRCDCGNCCTFDLPVK